MALAFWNYVNTRRPRKKRIEEAVIQQGNLSSQGTQRQGEWVLISQLHFETKSKLRGREKIAGTTKLTLLSVVVCDEKAGYRFAPSFSSSTISSSSSLRLDGTSVIWLGLVGHVARSCFSLDSSCPNSRQACFSISESCSALTLLSLSNWSRCVSSASLSWSLASSCLSSASITNALKEPKQVSQEFPIVFNTRRCSSRELFYNSQNFTI